MSTRDPEKDSAEASGSSGPSTSSVDINALAEKISQAYDSASDLPHDATVKMPRRTGYAPTVTPDSIQPVESDPVPHDADFNGRYSTRDLLGEGGMGEVRLTRDARIGRQVAMKVVRPGAGSRSDLRSRFLREARVQGQLEHPAIVPVYDLGTRPDGASYFTMKRVRGKTLEEVLDDLRAGEPAAIAEFSRRKLLSAFNSVCLAIDFAHARGVVHRDLKPGNVMLGGFGEVYVLDWGLAKVKGDIEPTSGPSDQVDAPLSVRGHTENGAVMGTPGYMAPEQLLSTDVDARADIYALGAMLFEICTLKPLHDKPKLSAVLDSTLRGPEARASVRAAGKDIPPELEAIWTKAIALKAEDRYESARAISEDIESFLDGDRDLEQRKKMADVHAERGEQAVARARTEEKSEERKIAMQELGRALALDPSNARALGAMGKLLSEAPDRLPPEAQEELAIASWRSMRVSGRAAFFAYSSWFLFFPFSLYMGYKDVWLSAVMGFFMLCAVVASLLMARSKQPSEKARAFGGICYLAAVGISSRVFGPFMVVPALVLANILGFSVTRERKQRAFIAAVGTAAFMIPLILEWTGVISPSYVFRDGHIEIMPHVLSFDHPAWTMALLVIAHLGIIVIAVSYIGKVRDHLKRYERHALVQAWHFRQLAPEEARVQAPDMPDSVRTPGCVVEALHETKALRQP
ncbi:MAG: protein kinase domain-containing protein [Polyangiaceae bacterium]